MDERLIYLGKVKCKEIDKDFDLVVSKYERRAKDKGYTNHKLKLIKEKAIVKFYVIIDLDEEI